MNEDRGGGVGLRLGRVFTLLVAAALLLVAAILSAPRAEAQGSGTAPMIDSFGIISGPLGAECIDQTITWTIVAEDPQGDLDEVFVEIHPPTMGNPFYSGSSTYAAQAPIDVDVVLPADPEPGLWTVEIEVQDVNNEFASASDTLTVPAQDCADPFPDPPECPSLTGWDDAIGASSTLAGWWPFDESNPAGRLAEGLGRFGAVTETGDAAAALGAGIVNDAENFDGAGAVDIDGVDLAIGSQTLTTDFWVNTTDTSRQTVIEHRENSINQPSNPMSGFIAVLWDDDTILWQEARPIGYHNALLDLSTASPVADGTWRRITIIRTSLDIHLFIDGIYQSSVGS